MTLEIICNQIIGLGIWCLTSLSTILSYIIGVSFIGGGNRNTRRKSLTCHKSLTNFITKYCIKYSMQRSSEKGQRTDNDLQKTYSDITKWSNTNPRNKRDLIQVLWEGNPLVAPMSLVYRFCLILPFYDYILGRSDIVVSFFIFFILFHRFL